MKNNLFMMLQLFADSDPAGEVETGGENHTEPQANDKPAKETKPELKYTDADIDRIINGKFAEWQKRKDEELQEAQKTAQMTAEQKQQHDMEKLQKENEELRREQEKIKLGRTAAGVLAEHKIEATQDILDFVVGADEADTSDRVDKFVKIVEAQLKKAEVERATGKTPKVVTNTGNALSEIDKRLAKYQ